MQEDDADERTTAPMRPRAPTPRCVGVGTTLGPYRLLADLGSGGMATVSMAAREADTVPHPRVALKVLHEHLARERASFETFLDEGRLGLRLEHESLCRVLEYGEAQGRPYVAMELLEGVQLARLLDLLEQRPELASDPGWPRQIVAIVAALAEGLHAAHELADETGQSLELVHRDVTPHNLYLVDDGGVRVADFGVALHRCRRHHTRTGMLKGKLGYTAPELFRHVVPDRRVDVWSLGVVLWELLVGERLFERPTDAAIVHDVLEEQIIPPSRLRRTVDRQLDTVVLGALAREPELRFTTAAAFARALRDWVGDARPESEASSRRVWVAGVRAYLMKCAHFRSSTLWPAVPYDDAPTLADGGRPHETMVAKVGRRG